MKIALHPQRQAGLTLIELMVAILLGLIVLVVVGQIYLSGRQSYRTQTGFSDMQEAGRFALYFLQRDIRMAGFPRESGPGGALSALNSGFVAATTTDGGTGSDQITIQYRSFGTVVDVAAVADELKPTVQNNNTFDESRRDCLGNQVTAAADGSIVVNRYWVSAAGDLMCEGSANPNQPQPIISGVESMQILYGVDTDNDGAPNTYQRANQVGNWTLVVAVRIGLLLNSQERVFDVPDTGRYALLDAAPFQPSDNAATAEDERLFSRRVFTTTIAVRNRSNV